MFEETGITVDPNDLRLVHIVHHRQDDNVERIGFFFEALHWQGHPINREPDKCLALTWFTVHELPDDIIEYPNAGLLGYLENAGPFTAHNWK
ncbi:NUDIX domain-containing protein [Streptomyces sp. NPDC096205]|uniref:NUDIX domain-containing protein n=1 Tax=Streptomyces sp. NPDC096205 TaxID=3366081 RepID=UPI0038117A7F